MLVDSHCHLDFPEFAEDFEQIMSRAAEANVGLMLTICTHLSRFPRVLAVAERFDNVYCTVGIHPHEAGEEIAVTAEQLITLADHPKVVGFGETGLDYY
jgi:TatD DNase family protein